MSLIQQRLPLRLCASAVSVALASMATTTSFAQETEQVVVVTAQSRSQQIQNVPIAVQTMSGAALKDIGVANLGDVDAFVPGLSIDTSQSVRPSVYLRGVGTQDFGIGTDSPVGIYTDGVYTGKNGGSLLNFNDVKRIEVLKGPQGTLFGRNAAAGAISIVTNDPVNRVEANGLVRVGSHGTRHAEALYNTPLTDSLSLRISAVTQQDDGWARNAYNGKRMGDDGDRGVRAAVRWQGDDSAATLSWEHEVMRASGPPVFSLTNNKINYGGPATWTNPLNTQLNNDAEPDMQGRTFDGVTLRIETPLSFATLTSTTAYRHYNAQNWQDNDAGANAATALSTGIVESNATWQQEFKLSGETGKINWVSGVSAYRERAASVQSVSATTTSLDTIINHSAGLSPYATLTALAQGLGKATGNAALQGVNLLGQSWSEYMHDKGEYRAYAVYGDAIWHVSDSSNLTLGGRYTHDQKSFSWYNPARTASGLDTTLAALNQANFFPSLVAARLLTATQAATLKAVTTSNIQFTNPGSAKAAFSADKSWNNFSPRVVLDHHLTPDHMAYVSWSKGYQSGGFDAVGVNGQYDKELVTNLEAGLKGSVNSLGLSYGASVFRYKYTNLQSLTLVPASATSGIPVYQIVNSDQKATGVDLEGQWKLNRIWRLNGSLEYLDQTYDHYVAPTGVSLDGQPAGAPYLSASAGVAAKWPVADGKADVNLMYGYQGKKRCNADTSATGNCLPDSVVGAGKARERVDARVGWTAASGRWGVGLVVSNLTNKQYVSVSTLGSAVGSPYVYVSKPRVIALELRAQL
ncbi:TonB-dependent receptor [Duganella sacchari]|uniref:TonB-dependent receptor n=1 Tax=Duganella sacchari TaxID=551987 RepID=UPI00142F3A86|nr:TonB-dependent receptor [Duganella sacchari]